jgi:hypothetical protein
VRYQLLIGSQKLVVPERARQLLGMRKFSWITPFLFFYKLSRKIKMDWFLKSLVMPAQYRKQIRDLDVMPAAR